MANCNQECNKQIQGLAARLNAAEESLTNQYAGMSALVLSLSGSAFADPTGTIATSLKGIYNGLPTGAELLKMLQNLIPAFDAASMKKIAMKLAAAMIDTMAAELDAAAAAMIAEATAAVDSATALVSSATTSLETAVTNAKNAPGALADAAVAQATDALTSASGILNQANITKILSAGFMEGQADIAKCKSASMHLI